MALLPPAGCLKRALARFRSDESATLSVELVLVLPLLSFWLATSFLFFDVFRVNMVNEKAAYTIADMISRQNQVDANFIEGTNNIFDFLINRRGATWLRATSVKYNAADAAAGTPANHEVMWSIATRGREEFDTAKFNDLDLDDLIPIMDDQETVIVTETVTIYLAPFSATFIAGTPDDDPVWGAEAPGVFQFNTFIVTRPRFVQQILRSDAPGT